MGIIKKLSIPMLSVLIQACTPAQLVNISDDSAVQNGKVLVYRESSFNVGGVPMIFGESQKDHKELWNDDYVELEFDEGLKSFFVRSNQADVPFELPLRLSANEKKCLKGYANPVNYAKVFFPIAYYMGNSFVLAEVACPTKADLVELDRVH